MLRLPDTIEEFRASLRQRIDRRIEPLIAGIDASGTFSHELWSEIRDAGIFGLPFPSEFGGADGSFLAFVVAVEELSRAGGIAGLYPGTTVQIAGTLLALGTEQQRNEWLPRLVAGEGPAAWAFTEPQTGSDPKQIQTTARRTGDGNWVLNGQKLFISFARQAIVALVFARVEDEGLGAFIVEPSTAGFSTGEPFSVLGYRGGEAAPIFLDDVVVPADALVGTAGKGFEVMLAGEARGKVRAATMNVGIAQRALEEAARYALSRTHRGQPIGEKFASIQQLLGDMDAQIQVSRSFVRSLAQLIDDGHLDIAREAAAARIITGRCVREVTSNALQICGAYGWTTELPLERLYREAKFFEVTQGVTEIQKSIAARSVLDEHRHQ